MHTSNSTNYELVQPMDTTTSSRVVCIVCILRGVLARVVRG